VSVVGVDARRRLVTELLKQAMAHQKHGAEEALEDLLRANTISGDVEAAYASPASVDWQDVDDAEMVLRRYLQRFTI
jgi:hypothetical protein